MRASLTSMDAAAGFSPTVLMSCAAASIVRLFEGRMLESPADAHQRRMRLELVAEGAHTQRLARVCDSLRARAA